MAQALPADSPRSPTLSCAALWARALEVEPQPVVAAAAVAAAAASVAAAAAAGPVSEPGVKKFCYWLSLV